MATLRCPGTRVQKPPYQWKTTNYHEWSWVNDQGEDVCAHCGKTRKEVTVPDSQLPKYPVEALAAVDSIAVTADSGSTLCYEGKKPVNLQPLKENYPNLQIKG
jgi:hypothetical protein